MKKTRIMTLYLCSLLPNSAFAALLDDKKLNENTGSANLPMFLRWIQSWLLNIVGGLAILFIVYGGFLYITSGGNKERVENAKKTLTWAIMGLLLVVFAGVIFEIITSGFLTSIFGSNSL